MKNYKNYIKENNSTETLEDKLIYFNDKDTRKAEEIDKDIIKLINIDDFEFEFELNTSEYTFEINKIKIISDDGDDICRYLDVEYGDLYHYIEYNKSHLTIEEDQDIEQAINYLDDKNLELFKKIFKRFDIDEKTDIQRFLENPYFSELKDTIDWEMEMLVSTAKVDKANKIEAEVPFYFEMTDKLSLIIDLEYLNDDSKSINEFILKNMEKLEIEDFNYTYDIDDKEYAETNNDIHKKLEELYDEIEYAFDSLDNLFFNGKEITAELIKDCIELGGEFAKFFDYDNQKEYIGDDVEKYKELVENGAIDPKLKDELVYLVNTQKYGI